MNEILQVATFAGQIILESGGETYRVEDTILRICQNLWSGTSRKQHYSYWNNVLCHKGEIYS